MRPGCAIPLAVLLVLYGWWLIERHKIESVAIQRVTDVYQKMAEGDYAALRSRNSIVNPELFEAADQVLGKVERFRITETVAGPAVVPMLIRVSVSRNGRQYDEKVIMHAPNGRVLQISPDVSNDQLWELNRRADIIRDRLATPP